MVDLNGKTLYEAIGVGKDASQAEIRKAYMKLALQLHPDKNPGDQSANDKFQTLQKVYAILSDEDKRKIYDQTGSIEDSEELAGEKFNELYRFYRDMFAKVTEEDLDAFHDTFRGSEEERQELLKYYQQFKGDMRKVSEWVMCSDETADSHRFKDLLDAAIAAKEVPSFAKYTAWAKKVAVKPRPKTGGAAKGKGMAKQQQEQNAAAALVARIRGRQQSGAMALPTGGVLGRLMAEMENSMPSEEDFQAAKKRLEHKKSSGSSSKRASSKEGKQKGGPSAAETAAANGSGGKRAKK